MPASRPNVRQHVVPQVYLEKFGDAGGTLQVQEVATGKVYPGNPPQLCVEKEVYTLIHERKRDDSCDRINNQVEKAVGELYNHLEAGVDLADEQTKREVFTTLAVFTANLIARSRVLRDHFNITLDAVNQFLTEHPVFLDDFPDDEYQKYLRDPAAYPSILSKVPGFEMFAPMLREYNEKAKGQATTDSTIEALKQLKKIHYPILLRLKTATLPEVMLEAGARADLLVPQAGRFISADDPVVFIADGKRATKIYPTDVQIWAAPGRGVYLPLRPDLAVHWYMKGTFSRRSIPEAEVQLFNRLVAENAIRQRFAREMLDFPA